VKTQRGIHEAKPTLFARMRTTPQEERRVVIVDLSFLVIERRMGEEFSIFLVAWQRFVLVVMMHDLLKGQLDGECEERTGVACRPTSCVALHDLYDCLHVKGSRDVQVPVQTRIHLAWITKPLSFSLSAVMIPEADFTLANKTGERI
jgi:hypothetical protein